MRISTRGRYGLRAMFELARGFGQAPILMSTVAQRQDLSRKYLHALLTALKAAGLVRSVRGIGGGFTLTKAPEDIRLSDILHGLEGPMSLVDCVADERVCNRSSRCPTRRIWQELAGAIENVLDNVTLKDLLAPERKKRPRPGQKETGPAARPNGRKATSSTAATRRGRLTTSKR